MRRVRRVILIIAGLLIASIVVSRVTGLVIPRGIGRREFFGGMLLASIAWWTLADEAIRAWVSSRSVALGLRIALCVMVLMFCTPVIGMVLLGRIPSMASWPIFFTSLFQLWHMTLFVAAPIATVVGYVIWGIWLMRKQQGFIPITGHANEQLHEIAPAPPATDFSSRREFLKAVGIMTPVVSTAALGIKYGAQYGKFAVNKYDLPAPWLPERLRGLTITQVSDLHLGRLYRPQMLPRLIDGVNRLKSDIVVVTGDIVDVSNDMLPDATTAFGQFEAPRGLYMCLGNHDLIDDRNELIEALSDIRWNLLVDRRMPLNIDGERITMLGLDWGSTEDTRWGNGFGQRARHALTGYDRDRDGPVIALAHHPHAFDKLSDQGVSLTLSGHTHGGQLMLVSPRADGIGDPRSDYGVGGMMFRYLRGFYRRGENSLFVNSGVGNWFPIRWNAPAEIVQIRLV